MIAKWTASLMVLLQCQLPLHANKVHHFSWILFVSSDLSTNLFLSATNFAIFIAQACYSLQDHILGFSRCRSPNYVSRSFLISFQFIAFAWPPFSINLYMMLQTMFNLISHESYVKKLNVILFPWVILHMHIETIIYAFLKHKQLAFAFKRTFRTQPITLLILINRYIGYCLPETCPAVTDFRFTKQIKVVHSPKAHIPEIRAMTLENLST